MFWCVALWMTNTGVLVIAFAQPPLPMSSLSVDAGANSIYGVPEICDSENHL